MTPILDVSNLNKFYLSGYDGFKKKYTQALNSVSFSLFSGETLAIVGESGSGKSTLARILAGAEPYQSGTIQFEGEPIEQRDTKERYRLIRMIFQDPTSSLNPNLRIGQILEEPLRFNTSLSNDERRLLVLENLTRVGLLEEHAQFYPHMISGGQRQRINIARALMLRPKIIIADGALSSLDVLVRSQILNLLIELQRNLKISFIFVSHDLHIIRHFSDRIMVLSGGEVVEIADVKTILESPKEEYTQRLIQEQSSMIRKNN